MPNLLTNVLEISGEAGVLACLDAIKGEPNKDGPRHIDFRRIVPMPPILAKTDYPTDKCALFLMGDEVAGKALMEESWVYKHCLISLAELEWYIRKHRPEAKANAILAMQAKIETGYWNWADWCEDSWGTYRNASCFEPLKEVTDTRAEIVFCTAWSYPDAAIRALSQQFPHLTFTLDWVNGEEGWCGTLLFRKGRLLRKESHDVYSQEADSR